MTESSEHVADTGMLLPLGRAVLPRANRAGSAHVRVGSFRAYLCAFAARTGSGLGRCYSTSFQSRDEEETMSEDRRLKQAVLDELQGEPSVNAAHIGVTAKGGVITLMGHGEKFL